MLFPKVARLSGSGMPGSLGCEEEMTAAIAIPEMSPRELGMTALLAVKWLVTSRSLRLGAAHRPV